MILKPQMHDAYLLGESGFIFLFFESAGLCSNDVQSQIWQTVSFRMLKEGHRKYFHSELHRICDLHAPFESKSNMCPGLAQV